VAKALTMLNNRGLFRATEVVLDVKIEAVDQRTALAIGYAFEVDR